MKRPERLVYYNQWTDVPRNGDTHIEAIFMDKDVPILFRARLELEECRELYADIFSVDDVSANNFWPEELLEACFCVNALKAEHKKKTEGVVALMDKCNTPNEANNL